MIYIRLILIFAVFNINCVNAQSYVYQSKCDGLKIDSTNQIVEKAVCVDTDGKIKVSSTEIILDEKIHKVFLYDDSDTVNLNYYIEFNSNSAIVSVDIKKQIICLKYIDPKDWSTHVTGYVLKK